MYDLNKCNIKDCNQKHYKYLLCKKHFTKYIFNAEAELIQSLIYRRATNSLNKIDILKIFINNIIHHIFLIRVYYVEHHPLESLFLINYRKNKELIKSDNTTKRFISDFDYDDNVYIPNLKSSYNTDDSNKYIEKFIDNKSEKKLISYYIFFFVVFSSIYFIINYLTKIKIENSENYLIIVTGFFLGIPLIYSGYNYILKMKDVLSMAMNNNLYLNEEDNELFLKKNQSLINRLNRNYEKKAYLDGVFLWGGIFCIKSHISGINDLSTESFIVLLFLDIIILLLAILFFKLSWRMFFLIHFVNRFIKQNFKFDLYDNDKSLGLTHIKSFFRSILIYNIILILSFYSFVAPLFHDQILTFYVLNFFFLGGNISSLYFLTRLYIWISKQFNELKKQQLEEIKTLPFLERQEKFKFLNDLNLNLVHNWNFKMKNIYFLIPLIIKEIIERNSEFLLNFFKSIGLVK